MENLEWNDLFTSGSLYKIDLIVFERYLKEFFL